ncbi:hypothetical protein SAMN04487894_11493 [Niabella drilacis]|uniref:Uncharacterized protein n=2 Tax=Niabella drilacis (strain DSM 25811 / CCM 8410 / CCUG 62505 / LMG 26954 / E90) TaxID=1285928 RepID=A0A1G6Y113_NIADE|nr:hypothetical protein SAMN04487894_11493 [Niabella drilacis]
MQLVSKIIGLSIALAFGGACTAAQAQNKNAVKESNAAGSLQKVRDLVIYRDSLFHNAFPSIIKKKDGTYLLAFRRAPYFRGEEHHAC